MEKGRLAVRKAVSAVKEISVSLSIPFTLELVFPPAYPTVRDTLTKIRARYPDSPVHVRPFRRFETALYGAPGLRPMA